MRSDAPRSFRQYLDELLIAFQQSRNAWSHGVFFRSRAAPLTRWQKVHRHYEKQGVGEEWQDCDQAMS